MASGASGVVIDEELYPALLDGLLAVSRDAGARDRSRAARARPS